MNKTTIVCLAEEREEAVYRLAELGIVHVVDVVPPQSTEADELNSERDRTQRALFLLEARKTEADGQIPQQRAADIVVDVLATVQGQHAGREEMAHLRQARDLLEPWGDFSAQLLAHIRAAGWQVHLCSALLADLPELPEDAVLVEIKRDPRQVYFAVVAPPETQLPDGLPHVLTPEVTQLKTIEERLAAGDRKRHELDQRLDRLSPAVEKLAQARAELDEKLAVAKARDGMGAAEQLSYLQGFVPAKNEEGLRAAAQECGWALLSNPAAADDPAVPTLLSLPTWLRMAKPIFGFIGILPAYNETDVSIGVLVFLTLFFGMIVGDAGYGILFLLIAVGLKIRMRAPERQLAIDLLLLLSIVTISWGLLTGNVFAIPAERLPTGMRGVQWFTDAALRNRHIQWLCFLIAAVHLSLARGWQAMLRLNSKTALGHIGWALLIWGNFFTAVELIVQKGSFPKFAYVLYGIGTVLILSCGVNWRDTGDIFNLPFSFINSFVDVLSYIRLFAVGLASYFIAASFNDMGGMVLDLSPWLMPAAVLVILFGHLLNIALALMGVLVHGVRLNTLEFSNHMGLTWAGQPFNPLRRTRVPSGN